MRLRLLMRRLTVSAPRMAVRSAMPWPLRWAIVALVAGFCAAIGLWAFEFGRDIAGLDGASTEQLRRVLTERDALREQLQHALDERNQAQAVANTADTQLTSARVAQEKLEQQQQVLAQENQRLRDDLGFFQRLIPAPTPQPGTLGESLAIRGLQAEVLAPGRWKWQVLIMQPVKNPPEFAGTLELSLSGLRGGRPWEAKLPGDGQSFVVHQYVRLEGELVVPVEVQVKAVTARVLQAGQVRTLQSVRL
jgi:hypothetical protein